MVQEDAHELGVVGARCLVQRRLDQAGADGVDPHPVLAEFCRQRAGEAKHAVLRGGIGGRVGRAHVHERLDRTDVDNPAPRCAQLLQKSVRHVEHAVEVDGHDVLPVLDHRFAVRGEGVAAVDAGIVD